MAVKPKWINVFASLALALILLAAGIFYFSSLYSEQKATADSFLRSFFSVKQNDLDALSGNVLTNETLNRMIQDKYARFFTEETLKKSIVNRELFVNELTLRQYHSTMSAEKIVLVRGASSAVNVSHYDYLVTVKISSNQGTQVFTADLKGALNLEKIEGQYKISDLKIASESVISKIMAENNLTQ